MYSASLQLSHAPAAAQVGVSPQLVQKDAPASDFTPTPHKKHVLWPDSDWYCPLLHSVHMLAPVEEYWPGEHSRKQSAPKAVVFEYFPALHDEQSDLPTICAKVPTPHILQEVEPTSS